MWNRLFREHPESVGETYTEHLAQASRFSGKLFVASLVCLIHGLLPFLFKKTGSRAITDLYECMVEKRAQQTRQPAWSRRRAPAERA